MNPSRSSLSAHSLRSSQRRFSIHPPNINSPTDTIPQHAHTPTTETPREGGAHTIPSPLRDEIYEINEIKRYEDFTTIDWVQDAVHEQARRRAKRIDASRFWDQEGTLGWRRKVRESYDAGQAWLVITIVGAAIGFNAAFLNIVTEWLADIKLGYCTTGFYLNESFCCWGADDAVQGCPEWRAWTPIAPLNYIAYFIFAVLFAFSSAVLVNSFAPYAAGSGISEIKVIIAGFIMKGFLGARTLIIKSLTLPLSIASGLSVGKEGPSVHFAVCTGNVISRWFGKYKRNAAKTREILTATAGAGVAVAFGSPIGGVLFSLEEMASYFPLKTLWRSYFCALVATGVLAAMNPFRTGQLVMFQVKYDRTWHSFELIFFVLLGVFGGLYGVFVMKWNLRSQAFRKKYLSRHPIIEATVLAGVTALICYPNMFLRINMTEMMEILFRECEGAHDYNGICNTNNRWSMVISLAIATIVRVLLVIVSYGCKVPAGIFVPSMAIGASFGRMVGILVQALYEAFPDSKFFAACEPDVPCITPGTYAFLGAGAALSGIMHLTVSVTVIMFELTGALTYILPTMIVVGVTKAVSDSFGKGGIADRMIWFNGFPFLDNKEDHIFNVPVSHAMTSKPVVLPATDFPVSKAENLLQQHKYQGFPIVEDLTNKVVIGFIGRTELQYAINRAKREGLLSPNAKCRFTSTPSASSHRNRNTVQPTSSLTLQIPSNRQTFGSNSSSSSRSEDHPFNSDHSPDDRPPSRTFDDIATSAGIRSIDFSQYVDLAPLTVHPRLPLETVMEIFKKMGPRVILVEHRGRLSGLVTVKDCLKYQFKVEAQEHTASGVGVGDDGHGHGHGSNSGLGEGIVEQKAWELIQWATEKVAFWRRMGWGRGRGRGGLLRLGSSQEERDWRRGSGHEANEWDGELLQSRTSSDIVDGTEELEGFVELEERGN
ncbi:chloride channel, other eukaryote [Blastomyces dermatitidis ER-3]|uniref:Chloride channel protein n=2 Tax=Blastomyces TaxID=229219 RepID=A0A179V0C4_BLAGS|nr:chloride channel, other eukaryote [Blastomyces gilchristii SLH14081]XP_045278991.1 chloride channel, other eukaryote [Blastomyces dermatitidis ER-3]OAS99263.1 chloride channel, other eukaryote [Blastomyces dermatitidis ER-3]OAT13755.1 chloride channel, other eukaryote [Blastomyces gilchristii SLH14081]